MTDDARRTSNDYNIAHPCDLKTAAVRYQAPRSVDSTEYTLISQMSNINTLWGNLEDQPLFGACFGMALMASGKMVKKFYYLDHVEIPHYVTFYNGQHFCHCQGCATLVACIHFNLNKTQTFYILEGEDIHSNTHLRYDFVYSIFYLFPNCYVL